MFESDAGAGSENVTAADKQVPFLMITQANSPQLMKNESKFIQGCAMGDVFNSVTGEYFVSDEGFEVVMCAFVKKIVEWKPKRGGFVTQHDTWPAFDTVTVMVDGKERTVRVVKGGENILVDTAYHFILYRSKDGAWAPAVVSMTSTQLKKSRNWITVLDALRKPKASGGQYKPPYFSHLFHLSTVGESNEAGKWFGWKIKIGAEVTDPDLYRAAKELHAEATRGTVQTAQPEDQATSAAKAGEDEIPF